VLEGAPQILPAIWDAASARAAQSAGSGALFLSGSALAASFGFPDIGLVRPDDLVTATARIAAASPLPLLVDGECGFGGNGQLRRYVGELKAAGATGILLEDQEFTGQSVAAAPGLGDPSLMIERIASARDDAGARLTVLARTDVIGPDWPFEQTLDRLKAYAAAGADLLTAVYLRSRTELAAAADAVDGRFVAIAVPGSSGYVPDPGDAFASGCRAVIVTGFLQAGFHYLVDLYRLALEGEIRRFREQQPDRSEFAAEMGFARFDPAPRSHGEFLARARDA
jgi:2-methylisocitrate lyase-like PEP mutase family enzyme